MLLSTLSVAGLAGAPERRWSDLDRLALLSPDQEGIAALDALALVRATLDGSLAEELLAARGLLAEAELVLEAGRPEQIGGFDPGAVRAWLSPTAGRRVRVSATFELDPPLFGQLRRHAARDPRLAMALGESPTLTLDIGWLFTRDLAVASTTLHRIHVGGTPFPTTGKDGAAWLTEILSQLSARLGEARVHSGDPAEQLLAAMLSDDPQQRARFARAAAALEAPPFELPPLRLVQASTGPASAFGLELQRARQLGPHAERALEWVVAVHLEAPDVLIVPHEPSASLREWLGRATTGDGASLEQVIALGRA